MTAPPVSEVPTTADIDVHGAAAVLEALRAGFTAELADVPDCMEWAGGTTLAVATRQIRFGTGQVIAEPGDLLLVRRDPHRDEVRTLPPRDTAWMPRICCMAVLGPGQTEDVITGVM